MRPARRLIRVAQGQGKSSHGQRGRAYSPAAGRATIGRLACRATPSDALNGVGCRRPRLPPGRWPPGRPVMGRRPRVDGRARAVDRRPMDGRTMDEARIAPAMPAGGPPQPNPRRHAKPHWYQPGPRQAELYQQYLRPPQTNCAFSTGEASASAAGGANAPTPSAASAGTRAGRSIPPQRREIRRACET